MMMSYLYKSSFIILNWVDSHFVTEQLFGAVFVHIPLNFEGFIIANLGSLIIIYEALTCELIPHTAIILPPVSFPLSIYSLIYCAGSGEI